MSFFVLFGCMNLLQCEKKNRCTVLGNIIDIKMIAACARVIARAG